MSGLSHLQKLEAEAIFIIREVAATCDKPVLLYSIGKDSAVLLHLAMKAFYPGKLPFPLLHVDTTWKFREMIEFRDQTARRLGLDLIVHVNEDGVKRGINPFDSGSSLHTQVMKRSTERAAGAGGASAAGASTGATFSATAADIRNTLPASWLPSTPRRHGR